MQFYSFIILAISVIAPVQCFALEEIGDGDESEIDFRGTEPAASAEIRNDSRLDGRPAVGAKRFGATSHFSAGVSTTSGRKEAGYAVGDSSGRSISLSVRLFDYVSMRVSSGRSGMKIEYDQLRTGGSLFSNDYHTFDAKQNVDSKSRAAGLRIDLLGMASSTPYIAVSRSKITQESDLTITARHYNGSGGGTLLGTETFKEKLGDESQYITSWTLGYELLLSRAASVSSGLSHALYDDERSRSFAVSANIWLSSRVAVGFGVSRNHDSDVSSAGFDLSLTL